jgi:hypothetical protein
MPSMTSFIPENIKVRKVALWGCSIVGFIFLIALATKAAISLYFFDARNPVAIILLLMLFTGIMHTIRKELRIPAITLSVVSIAALLILFFGGIHS